MGDGKFRLDPVVESSIENLLATINEHFVVIIADGLVSQFLAPEFAYDIRIVDDVSEAEDDHRRIIQLPQHLEGGNQLALDSGGHMVNEEDMRLEMADCAFDDRTANCLGFLPADAKTEGRIDSSVDLDQRRDLYEIYSLR